MRPSPGVVLEREDDPRSPGFAVDGPIARTAADLTALLATMAEPQAGVLAAEHADGDEPRVAWLEDLCQTLPFEAGILDVCRAAAQRWSPSVGVRSISLGAALTDSLWSTWLTIRHDSVGGWLSQQFSDDQISRMKPEAQWEVEGYRQLGEGDLRRADVYLRSLRAATAQLFDECDLLVLPTAQTWPIPVEQRWPPSIAGTTMSTYHRWMEVAAFATLAGLPALAVPAGRNEAGLHIGLQVIGRPGGDNELLGWLAWAERRGCFTVERPTSAVRA
jgi:amidase